MRTQPTRPGSEHQLLLTTIGNWSAWYGVLSLGGPLVSHSLTLWHGDANAILKPMHQKQHFLDAQVTDSRVTRVKSISHSLFGVLGQNQVNMLSIWIFTGCTTCQPLLFFINVTLAHYHRRNGGCQSVNGALPGSLAWRTCLKHRFLLPQKWRNFFLSQIMVTVCGERGERYWLKFHFTCPA